MNENPIQHLSSPPATKQRTKIARQHILHSCSAERCFVCENGLMQCNVCGLTGNALTVHCPGRWIRGGAIPQAVSDGFIDYRNGKWVIGKELAEHVSSDRIEESA